MCVFGLYLKSVGDNAEGHRRVACLGGQGAEREEAHVGQARLVVEAPGCKAGSVGGGKGLVCRHGLGGANV